MKGSNCIDDDKFKFGIVSLPFEVIVAVWVWCDPVVAFQRNSQRNPRVSRESFMRLASTFEPPRDALVIDSRATSPEDAAKKILTIVGENLG